MLYWCLANLHHVNLSCFLFSGWLSYVSTKPAMLEEGAKLVMVGHIVVQQSSWPLLTPFFLFWWAQAVAEDA